uniref:Uncharacterized protein n=1 Tax=Rhizophora mucronata TaxID=61149 RepID=A0A2P2N7U5_RHIMU
MNSKRSSKETGTPPRKEKDQEKKERDEST